MHSREFADPFLFTYGRQYLIVILLFSAIPAMTFQRSFCPNYFALEDIMVTQESIPCTTELPLKRLGFILPGNDKEDILENTQLDLPLWLAMKLTDRKSRLRPAVRVHIPKVFNERSRDIFEADAKVVNLHRVNPHFYEFGLKLGGLQHRESELIQTIVIRSFKERFRLMTDWADNVMVEPKRLATLDVSERNLLKKGQRARSLLDAWLNEGVTQMEAADMVISLRKRKLMEES